MYRAKYGKNKAFLSESYIRIVKRRLYMSLRGSLNQNWVKFLEIVVKNLNNIPNEKLGFLKPSTIGARLINYLGKDFQKLYQDYGMS